MSKFPCNGDWHVEYADGELNFADSAQAELHLAACPGCSREVAALQSSREKLSAYFAAAVGSYVGRPFRAVNDGLESPSHDRDRSRPQTGWNVAALALASIAATALLVSMFFFLERERREVVRAVTPPAGVPAVSPAVEKQEEDDILALISRETQIARLRTASEIFAREPGMNDRHLAMEKYLAEAYGVTTTRQPIEM
jgi:Putative zinc-finger